VYVPVSRLEEGELFTAFELIALGAATVATLEATLAPEAREGTEMLLEDIVVT
jgi:hypothetical protein